MKLIVGYHFSGLFCLRDCRNASKSDEEHEPQVQARMTEPLPVVASQGV